MVQFSGCNNLRKLRMKCNIHRPNLQIHVQIHAQKLVLLVDYRRCKHLQNCKIPRHRIVLYLPEYKSDPREHVLPHHI